MEVDLNGIFIDPDGDEMTFSATSSNSEILLAGVDANFLTLAPQSVGYSEVYVTADDGNGGSASDVCSNCCRTWWRWLFFSSSSLRISDYCP